MKITVLVSSQRHLDTAGVRIRYQRLVEPVARQGWALEVVPIDQVEEILPGPEQVYVFSKCQDARALAFASSATSAGCIVGVDLFDDYFSQDDDARFAGQRLWLDSMAQTAHFFLCSTPRMLEVGARYFRPDAGHVLNDPHEDFDPLRLQRELEVKIRKAKRERRIPILWFGIADNPNFPVGLHDLVAFGDALRPFRENDYQAELTILTNTDAIDSHLLEGLRRLPIRFVIRGWSQAREAEALSRSLVSFLPVNFQQFSIAKSLNRGVSALVGGTQLLTAGYPLYEALGAYAYRDATTLIEDLENSALRLSSDNVAPFAEWIGDLADPNVEAQKLVDFIGEQVASAPADGDDGQPCAVLHGRKSTSSINTFSQHLGWLTLGSPLVPAAMQCDAHLGFFGPDGSLGLRVSQAALDHLPEELRVGAVWADASLGKGPPWHVPLDAHPIDPALSAIAALVGEKVAPNAALSLQVMRLTRDYFAALFHGPLIVHSELDQVSNVIRAFERQ